MNQFDRLANQTFAATTAVMGYDCAWLPSDGSAPIDEDTQQAVPHTAKVHFKNPAQEVETTELGSGVNQLGYMPEMPSIEYLEGAFPGLMQSVREGNDEYITITQYTTGNLVGYFQVREVNPIHDGRTFAALLNPIEEIPTPDEDEEEYVP